MGEVQAPAVNGGDAEQQPQQLQLPGQATLSPDHDPEVATIPAAKAGSGGEDTRINLEVLTKPDAALGSSPSVSSAPSGTLPPSSAALAKPEAPEEDVYVSVTWKELIKQWFIMGWIGFGGPAAHIGLFQRWFVERLKWMSNGVFMEIFALGQCLPGPTSTQVSFAIGTIKKGVLGGLASGALFQYPGAIIMTLLGALAAKWLKNPPGWLSGIVAGVSAVGVALVAVAAKGLLMKLCNRKMTAAIGTLSAGAAIYWSEPWLFPLLILIGGIITIIETFIDLTIAEWKKGAESARHRGARALRHAVLAEWRKIDEKEKDDNGGLESLGFGMKGGAVLVALWAAVLVTVLVLARTVYKDQANPLNWFEVFYRIGSIIYGGGQVVLPMIFSDVVKQDCTTVSTENGGTSSTVCVERADTWMTAEQFYAGLGAVQAMPGPLFNFSSYLGAIIAMNFGYTFILGAVLAWFGLFSPGVLLMFGVLPYWKRFRRWQLYRRALPGFNAVGVGLILASVFKMTVDVYQISPFPSASLCIGLFGFTAVNDLGLFEPIVVIAGLVLGIIAWAGDLN